MMNEQMLQPRCFRPDSWWAWDAPLPQAGPGATVPGKVQHTPPIDMLSTYYQTQVKRCHCDVTLFAVKRWDNWRRRRNWPKMDEPS